MRNASPDTPQRPQRHSWQRILVFMGVGALGFVFAAACSETASEPTGDPAAEEAALRGAACDGLDVLECARQSTIASLVPDEPEVASGEPLVLGVVNQESTPAGSFPELSEAMAAAAKFVNDQLGGVAGRPVELRICNTDFSAEGSTACGQRLTEAGAVAVLGGIDVFGNAIEILDVNDVPYVGGVPISFASVRSPNSFQFSGGTWGAAVALADYATTELGAQRVSVVFGDFGAIADGAGYARTVLEARGVETQLVPHPILATDLTSPLSVVAASEPDAVIVLTADTGCRAAFGAVGTVQLDVPVMYTGACAAPNIVAAADPAVTDGALFNVEGPVSTSEPQPDFALYVRILDNYAPDLDPIGAPTVTFRSFMNLYAVLAGLADGPGGPDAIDASAVAASLADQRDTPSFMGHPYTCNGEQIEGLPAMCAPQQIIAQLANNELVQRTGWVDVGRIFDESR